MSLFRSFNKKFNSLLIALSLFGIGASVISVSPALATSGDGNASISGSVVTVPSCSYGISGVSTSIALTANNTYNPDNASGSTILSGSDSNITISGFPGGTYNSPCSFYGSTPSSPKMKVNLSSTPAWSGTCSPCSAGFNISWSVSSSNPITVTPSQSSAIGVPANDCSATGVTLTPATLTSSTSANIVTISGSTPKQCDALMTISTPMPSGLNQPAGTKTYTVTGPTVTFTYSGS